MKTLIYSQCFLTTEEQGRFLGVNLELVQRLNPGWDILLIDNASPMNPLLFLIRSASCVVPALRQIVGPDAVIDVVSAPLFESGLPWFNSDWVRLKNETDKMPEGGPSIFRFPDSIGHFSHKFVDERPPEEARDGPGRAHMTALRIAINSGYERVVFIEDDAMFFRPFEEGFAQMTKPFACLPRGKWGYLDWNVFWINDLAWLDKFDFIGRYDWQNQRQGPGQEGERKYEWILGDNLQVLPFKGGRGEGFINEKNLRAVYPDGCDWSTHVSHATFAELLRWHGHDDLAAKL